MSERRDDFYQHLRSRIREWLDRGGTSSRWSDYVMVGPDLLHLLYKLTLDPDVPVAQKARLAAALAYFVSPFDLIPEAITGPAGYVDDVALSAYVLNSLVNAVDRDVLTRHWAGSGNVLELVQRILKVADRMVGTGLWGRLKRLAR